MPKNSHYIWDVCKDCIKRNCKLEPINKGMFWTCDKYKKHVDTFKMEEIQNGNPTNY